MYNFKENKVIDITKLNILEIYRSLEKWMKVLLWIEGERTAQKI